MYDSVKIDWKKIPKTKFIVLSTQNMVLRIKIQFYSTVMNFIGTFTLSKLVLCILCKTIKIVKQTYIFHLR